ncbi:hypothetical protein [Paenibacillus tarimensis]|uniref:hypothetical protein n=1 Tax=Paenibacillus tarimensis TaxID=416012 RepID=UPI001F27F8E5|nr:hypothetical protein [Paenibacillus tarimensis]MCF2945893.1 hypothetical protein [Paenibacillus tarimensis]
MRKLLIIFTAVYFVVSVLGVASAAAENDSSVIYKEKRAEEFKDNNQWVTIQAGEGGIRFISNDKSKELMLVDNFGGIYMNADLFVNGKKLNDITDDYIDSSVFAIAFAIILIVVLILFILLVFMHLKLKKKFTELERHIKFNQ